MGYRLLFLATVILWKVFNLREIQQTFASVFVYSI